MPIVDTHAHLDDHAFRHDLDAVLQRAARAGVTSILCVGTDLASSRRCVELAGAHPGLLRAAVGIHPNSWAQAAPGDLEEIVRLADLPEVVAIGETGLDFHRDHTPRAAQLEAFRRHVRLALAVGKPLVVHSRKADKEVLGEIAQARPRPRGVRHCFEGDAAAARRYLDLGFFVAVGGTVTRPGYKRLKAALRALPADRLLIETDCPYQSPASRAGTRNEPAFIRETLEALAALRGEPAEALAEATARSAERLFGPGPAGAA